jgi:Phage P22-like portal protein
MADKDSDFLATARKRFAAAAEDEKELREKFSADLKFASPDGDDQWDPQVKQQREMSGRPAMSFPRCHTFVQQVSNEARQNKPQVKFSPRLDADKDTADVYEGLARFIQYASDAQVAYETAVEYSAGGSFGYYRFLTDYVDDDSDDQDLKIVPVLDPLQVYGVLVPACFNRKPKFWFVVEDVPKEEFKAKYPDSELTSMSWDEAERVGEGWVGSEAVRIAEYWWDARSRGGPRAPMLSTASHGRW